LRDEFRVRDSSWCLRNEFGVRNGDVWLRNVLGVRDSNGSLMLELLMRNVNWWWLNPVLMLDGVRRRLNVLNFFNRV
jgi:hypothetical protein